MSRSHRRTPIFGNAKAGSEKDDKRRSHGSFRVRQRAQMAAGEDVVIERQREAMNPATMSKDGRHWWKGASEKDMAK
jgi:hypothetical protein